MRQHEYYTHIEQPTGQLTARLGELAWAENNITHSEARKTQLGHEAACVAFELVFRELRTGYPGQLQLESGKTQ